MVKKYSFGAIVEAVRVLNPGKDPLTLSLDGADHDVIFIPSSIPEITEEIESALDDLGVREGIFGGWVMYV